MSIIIGVIGSIGAANRSLTLNYYIPNPASEGSPLDVFYNYSNFNGQTVYWSLDYSSGIGTSNFTGATSGSFTLTGSGGDVVVIYPKNDYHTQGNWTVKMLFGSSPGLSDYFDTGWMTVQDTSRTVTATIVETYGAVNEGQTNTFTFTETSTPAQLAGKTLYWYVSGATGNNMNPSRFNGGGVGSFVMNNASIPVGTFDVIVSADHKTSSDQQSYQIEVYSADPIDPNSGAVSFIATGSINVNDTSQTVPVFSLNAPPANSSGLPWTDNATGITANITNTAGNWGYTSNYNGGIVWDNTNHGYVTLNYSDTSTNFTLSFAADLEPGAGHWNSLFGDYYGNGPFAYANLGGSISAGVGSATTVSVSSGANGLAWWDFVYSGTTLTIYKNGSQVATGTLPFACSIGSNLQIGTRNGVPGDYLVGTLYQIKYQNTALDSTGITTQYNNIKSIYGLS